MVHLPQPSPLFYLLSVQPVPHLPQPSWSIHIEVSKVLFLSYDSKGRLTFTASASESRYTLTGVGVDTIYTGATILAGGTKAFINVSWNVTFKISFNNQQYCSHSGFIICFTDFSYNETPHWLLNNTISTLTTLHWA